MEKIVGIRALYILVHSENRKSFREVVTREMRTTTEKYPLTNIVESSVQRNALHQNDRVKCGLVVLLRGQTVAYLVHSIAFAEEIRVAVGTIVTKKTVRNRLLQRQFQATRVVA
ncbi:hypothetical protein TNCV_654851 [Trichonephila clavipes]|nr:hypothetical protein TNCV_654851 [Trichonephila clavipes]